MTSTAWCSSLHQSAGACPSFSRSCAADMLAAYFHSFIMQQPANTCTFRRPRHLYCWQPAVGLQKPTAGCNFCQPQHVSSSEHAPSSPGLQYVLVAACSLACHPSHFQLCYTLGCSRLPSACPFFPNLCSAVVCALDGQLSSPGVPFPKLCGAGVSFSPAISSLCNSLQLQAAFASHDIHFFLTS